MDINSNIILRERSNLSSKAKPISSSIFLSTSSIPYHKHMELENNKPENDTREPINSSQLSYKDNTDKDEFVSKMANTSSIDEKLYIYQMWFWPQRQYFSQKVEIVLIIVQTTVSSQLLTFNCYIM